MSWNSVGKSLTTIRCGAVASVNCQEENKDTGIFYAVFDF